MSVRDRKRGRPRAALDLDRARLVLARGGRIKEAADAVGCNKATLLSHLETTAQDALRDAAAAPPHIPTGGPTRGATGRPGRSAVDFGALCPACPACETLWAVARPPKPAEHGWWTEMALTALRAIAEIAGKARTMRRIYLIEFRDVLRGNRWRPYLQIRTNKAKAEAEIRCLVRTHGWDYRLVPYAREEVETAGPG